MNKEQAKQVLQQGATIQHQYFGKSEWIKQNGDDISSYITEDGHVIPASDFWRYRVLPKWDDGWELFKESVLQS